MRLTFLTHPYCYAESLMVKRNWKNREYHEHELPVARRWFEAIDRMDEADVVVYQPCYESAEEKALAEHARRRLGDRFLRLTPRDIQTPEGASPETMAALAPDISEACRVRGVYTWTAFDLRLAVVSYHLGREIRSTLAQRGIEFDPGQVTCRSWGESFDGCATTWTTMVPVYLGVEERVVLEYEMTVPDMPLLIGTRFVKRVPLAHDTGLFLWLGADGKPIAYYTRERVRLQDPAYLARLALPADGITVYTKTAEAVLPPRGDLAPTMPAGTVRRFEDGVAVMVASARGRGGVYQPFSHAREAPLYLVGEGVAPDRFFAAAEAAVIASEEPG